MVRLSGQDRKAQQATASYSEAQPRRNTAERGAPAQHHETTSSSLRSYTLATSPSRSGESESSDPSASLGALKRRMNAARSCRYLSRSSSFLARVSGRRRRRRSPHERRQGLVALVAVHRSSSAAKAARLELLLDVVVHDSRTGVADPHAFLRVFGRRRCVAIDQVGCHAVSAAVVAYHSAATATVVAAPQDAEASLAAHAGQHGRVGHPGALRAILSGAPQVLLPRRFQRVFRL
eukprot:scaffold1014_cov260-Pinguiococcus_pyrenoidosus.AAC.15